MFQMLLSSLNVFKERSNNIWMIILRVCSEGYIMFEVIEFAQCFSWTYLYFADPYKVHQSVLLCLSQVKKVCWSARIVPGRVRTVKWLSLGTVRFVKMIYRSWIYFVDTSSTSMVAVCHCVNGCCRQVWPETFVGPYGSYELWNGFTYRTVGSYDSSKWFTDGEPTLPIRKVRQWVLLCLGQEVVQCEWLHGITLGKLGMGMPQLQPT
jgi:hypothetical protein